MVSLLSVCSQIAVCTYNLTQPCIYIRQLITIFFNHNMRSLITQAAFIMKFQGQHHHKCLHFRLLQTWDQYPAIFVQTRKEAALKALTNCNASAQTPLANIICFFRDLLFMIMSRVISRESKPGSTVTRCQRGYIYPMVLILRTVSYVINRSVTTGNWTAFSQFSCQLLNIGQESPNFMASASVIYNSVLSCLNVHSF